MAGKLFVVSGPSGAGKGTLLAQVVPQTNSLRVAISATTRQPREGEREGVDYHFLSDDKFDELIATNGLLEWAFVHGARYGTLRSEVQALMKAGEHVILEIDPQGARQIKGSYPDAIMIFIEPPSLEVLSQRLHGRGTDSAAAIELRLANAADEMARAAEYDKVIVNDDLSKAVSELKSYIEQHCGNQPESNNYSTAV